MTAEAIVNGLFWSVVGIGGGLICYHLAGYVTAWRRAQTVEQAGIMVPSERCVRIGQTVVVTMGEGIQDRLEEGTLLAAVHESSRKTLTLMLERDPLRRHQDWPGAGQTVTVTLIGESGLYCFSASVRAANFLEQGSEVRLLEVELPDNLLFVQRREYARVPLRVAVTLENCEASDSQKPQAMLPLPLRGAMVDLSGGGVRVEVQGVVGANETAILLTLLPVGTALRVRISLPGLYEAPLSARVQKIERVVVRGGLGARLACKFEALTVWEQDLVTHYVFSAQNKLARSQEQQGEIAASFPLSVRA